MTNELGRLEDLPADYVAAAADAADETYALDLCRHQAAAGEGERDR